ARPGGPAAVPARRRERGRDAAHPPPRARPAPAGDERAPARPRRGGADHAPLPGGPRVLGDRDADPRQVDARGRARLPGPGPAAPRLVLRAAAVAAAVQAADAARGLR